MGMCTAPAMCPVDHSSSVRTSSSIHPPTAPAATSAGLTVGTSRENTRPSLRNGSAREVASSDLRSLQQSGQPTIGQLLATGLAGRAVLQRGVGEGDLGDRVPADVARLTLASVHPESGLLLPLEVLGGQPFG